MYQNRNTQNNWPKSEGGGHIVPSSIKSYNCYVNGATKFVCKVL